MWVTTRDRQRRGPDHARGRRDAVPSGSFNTAFGIAVGPDGNLWISTVIGVTKVPPADPNNPTAHNDVGLNEWPRDRRRARRQDVGGGDG